MSECEEKLALSGGEKYRTKPFAKWPEFDQHDIDGLLEVVNSGIWSRANYTSHLKFTYESDSVIGRFEQKLIKYQQTDYGVFVNSGTSALHLSFEALDLEPGSEVITTPYTFFATTAPLYKMGLKPVFADIDQYGNLDPERVEECITKDTKAVLLMHCAGYPCKMDRFRELCDKHNLYLIQDCAHAVTSTYLDKPVASYGDISIFSFEASKTLNSGEGGFVTTNSKELFEKIFSIHSCGRPFGGDWRSHVLICENYRPSEFQGVIATTQLEKLPDQTKRRNFAKAYLDEALKDHPMVEPVPIEGGATQHGNYAYVLRIREAFKKKLTGKRLAIYLETEGIPCNSGYKKLVYDIDFAKQFTTKEERNAYKEHCPMAVDYLKYTVWIPQTILISPKEDLDDVVGAINKIYRCLSK